MRRFAAIVLAALLSFPLIAPALLAADQDSRLPACCRRNGEHRCGMSSGPASGTTLQNARCAAFPSPQQAVGQHAVSLGDASLGSASAPAIGRVSAVHAELRVALRHERSFERGPPHLS